MKLSLISRSFQPRIQGIGVYSEMLYESIKNNDNLDIIKISQDDSFFIKNNPLGYVFFILIELPFKLKKSDINHALTPMETFYLDPKKTVVTIYDLIPIKIAENSSILTKAYKILFNQAMKKSIRCNKIVAISEETAMDIQKYYNVDHDKIKVIRPCIIQTLFPKNEKHEKFCIGTISQLNSRKRVDLLIKAFIKADIPDSKLLIGGSGPDLENLKKIADNNDKIEFLGFVPDENINDFYNSLDVFVFPTIMEGYGLPIVEAMACGKPVITLNDAQIPLDIKKRTHISTLNSLADDLKNKKFHCNIGSNLNFAMDHSPKNLGKEMEKIYNSFDV